MRWKTPCHSVFVFVEAQTFAQTQLQDEIILCTAAAVHDGRGLVPQKGFGVGGVVEPFAAHAGVGRRADAQIVAAVPVDEVVLSLIARAGEVGDLILPVAMMFQLLDGVEVKICRLVGGGQTLGGVWPKAESGSIFKR